MARTSQTEARRPAPLSPRRRRSAPLGGLALAFGVAVFAFAGPPAAAAGDAGPGPESWIDDLTPIGPDQWNYRRAAHLLERAGFGGRAEEIEALRAMTPATRCATWCAISYGLF